MQHSVDQRYAIKFCIKLEKSATKTLAIIQKAYGKCLGGTKRSEKEERMSRMSNM
jgi:hypothetical protein